MKKTTSCMLFLALFSLKIQADPAPEANKTPSVDKTKTATPTLDCNYHLSAQTKNVDTSVVTKWAINAVQQSFNFDFNKINTQLDNLKNCYTEQGWKAFNDALQQSGNVEAIKTQKLMVSGMVNTEPKLVETKENQWKFTMPLQVVYQNDKEKLTQTLGVDLLVGRKISGDLGIIQIIASPEPASKAEPAKK